MVYTIITVLLMGPASVCINRIASNCLTCGDRPTAVGLGRFSSAVVNAP
jgi:hypothetical protein